MAPKIKGKKRKEIEKESQEGPYHADGVCSNFQYRAAAAAVTISSLNINI